MAVPKRKTTPSKRNMRRSHHRVKSTNIIEDKKTTSKIIHPIVSGEQLNCNHYLHSSTSYTR